ncbi:glycerophosphodiester phosphodiesterase [Natronincola ferrireducens]|uniref:Glycerophosphoryl diester phosphodiesterase n=1 Tax=Natronincola ferrireducens TaxID=393762 RepID=A0A1G8YGV2_9FIRM|nr:glycerophosphodiester phosphodiesterase [Natronincola ferrireducens]SDK01923.1 glycerophosphoryl diester phosphodiesterase [Natronincola ferrireducens]
MLIIAHRGASGYAPENTLAAMDLAMEQGCDGIEIDVQLTKDGVVVVHHDWSVDRTTNGSGEIKDLTWKEIQKLDAGFWFSEEFTGEKVPTLDDVLKHLPKTLLLNVEVKSRSFDDRGLEKKVVELLEKHHRLENTVVSSFNHLCLQRIQLMNPQVKIGILYEAHLLEPCNYFKANDLNLYSFHPCHYYLTPDLVKKVQDNGMKIYSWTINDGERGKNLKALGIDGIITNYPDMLR